MGRKHKDILKEKMKDPAFREEWKASEPEYQIIRAIIEGREALDMSQQELSAITGIAQSDISKLENGNANPSLRTLQRLANGLGRTIHLDIIPDEKPTAAKE